MQTVSSFCIIFLRLDVFVSKELVLSTCSDKRAQHVLWKARTQGDRPNFENNQQGKQPYLCLTTDEYRGGESIRGPESLR